MLFNSSEFLFFFLIVYGLYLVLDHRWQNRMLLVASYVFYGAWDWRFLGLLLASTVIDFICGNLIHASQDARRRRTILAISMGVSLGILGFFKYFNFFIDSLNGLLAAFGIHLPVGAMNIILPVGISFYTFQTMSYTIDVYRGALAPAKRFSDFALFVSYFPQLVAGPIERATHLLPQIEQKRTVKLDDFYEGCYLIFWGLFQKVFIADNLSVIVDRVFSRPAPYHPSEVLMAVYAFAFQIYCDFAGYSHMARGLSRLMGIEIMWNFNLPYFAANPREFWQRWHISLSTWLRDYLYIPLGGNKGGLKKTVRNLLITMVLGGLWHGAAWNFVLWGFYHGIVLVLYRLREDIRGEARAADGAFIKGLKIILFFHVTCLGWLFFRAQSLGQIAEMMEALLFGWHRGIHPALDWWPMFGFLHLLFVVEAFQYYRKDLMAVYRASLALRYYLYFAGSVMLIIWGVTDAQDFIYFQF